MGGVRNLLAARPDLAALKATLVAVRRAETEAEQLAERARAKTNEARDAYFAAEAVAIDTWIARCAARRARARTRRAS